MRAVFINTAHPDTPHVSGQRIPTFARILAARGWRIVLMTPALPSRGACTPGSVRHYLEAHDWSRPLHIAVALEPVPEAKLLLPSRKVKSALRLLSKGHIPNWPRAARPFIKPLADHFQPELIWSVFSVSDFYIAQQLSRKCGCPWVADFKDNYETFISAPFRRLVAARFSDLIGATSNAQLHAVSAARFFSVVPTVIYSGVAHEMIAPAGSRPDPDRFQITVIGGLYGKGEMLLAAISRWLAGLSVAERVCVGFRYAGGDHKCIASAAAKLDCASHLNSYLPLSHLGELTKSAGANVYVWSPKTFHHKALELLACRRPVIAWGGEHPETHQLATYMGAELEVCETTNALCSALSGAFEAWLGGTARFGEAIDAEAVTWERFADYLADTLKSVARGPVSFANNHSNLIPKWAA